LIRFQVDLDHNFPFGNHLLQHVALEAAEHKRPHHAVEVAQRLSIMTSAAAASLDGVNTGQCIRERYNLSLLLLSNSDITLSPTLLKVRGIRNMSSETISTKLFAMGVPVSNTLRRQLSDKRRLTIRCEGIEMRYFGSWR
jgi:hypothetical protein